MTCGCIDTIGGVPRGGVSDVVLQGAIVREVDVLAPTGSVDNTVFLFDGAMTQVGSVALASWIRRTDSATLGTTFDILQRGLYACLFYVPLAAAQTTQAGVTYNAPIALRQGNFEPFDPDVFSSNFKFASTTQGHFPTQALIPIGQGDVDAGTAVIRAQMSDVAGGAPPGAAFVDPLNVALRIFRVGEMGA